MTSEIKSCYIYSDDDSRPPILLPDEKPIIVGRCPATQIRDKQCSRNQVRLYASYASQSVAVQQMSKRCSGLNGLKIQKDSQIVARHGDCLEIPYGCNRYRIEFNPAPTCIAASALSKRRSDAGSDGEAEYSEEEQCMGRLGKRPKIQSEAKESLAGKKVHSSNEAEMQNNKNSDSDEKEIVGSSSQHVNSKENNLPRLSLKPAEKDSWEELGTLMIYTMSGVESRSKIAAYDMDNTLIKTQSGQVFPKDHNDWQILYPEVPGKLKKLHANGYKIVIFTNQGGMFLGKIKPSDFKLKIERVVKKLGIPVQAFIATGKDVYRKPRTGMWEKLVNDKNDGVSVDKSQSLFVGDAAGRAKDWAPNKKKDHSSADRLLGLNLALPFHTPEEHFLGHKPAPFILPGFDPKKLPKVLPLYEPSSTSLISTKQEVVLMVGGPGSGKSHIAKTHLKSYHHINRDKLGSWQKCVAALENALSQGKSVVVDNTNPDVPSRQRYINVAKAQGVPVRCFVMTTDKEHARHNNKFRELTDPSHMTVTDVIINSYSYTNSTLLWRCTRFLKLLLLLCLRLLAGTLFTHVQPYRKNYVPPKPDEGFAEIVRINCVPRFANNEHRKLYEMFLLEK